MLRTGIANKGFSGGFSGVFQRKQMPERRDIFLNIQLSDALKECQISSIFAGKTVGVAVIAPAVVEKAVSKTVTAIGEYLAASVHAHPFSFRPAGIENAILFLPAIPVRS